MAVRITVNGQAWIADSVTEAPEDCQRAMVACFTMGQRPTIETVAKATIATPFSGSSQGAGLPFPDAVTVNGTTYESPPVPVNAAERIQAQHTALRDAGVNIGGMRVMGHVGAGVSYKDQTHYSTKTQDRRKAEHEKKMSLHDVAHAITESIQAEHREDVEMSAAELARNITVNGKIHVAGRALTEQAIRGLAARLESPMLGYVLGLRERMISEPKHAMVQADKERIAEVLRHECARNPDVKLQLRTRNGGSDDVYACVSPSYVPADATMILPEILDALPPDTKASYAYDPASTQWEIRASVWTPTPVADHAVGEAYEGYVSLRSRDNGTSKFRGDGGISMLACLNAMSYNAGGASVSRVHRGKVARDVEAMISVAKRSIDAVCAAWGLARAAEIPMSPEERASGDKFLSALWLDMLKAKPLEGVLVGRKSEHVSGLVSAYHAERRDPVKLVRSDLAQGWTRYIQKQPADTRRDAEAAIGSWLVDA